MEPLSLFLAAVAVIILLETTYLVASSKKGASFRKQRREILLDTSALIDGRIVSVAEAGFIGATLVIPRSVVGELQFLADNADHEKRARARYGLDVVAQLQAMPKVDVELLQDGSKADEGVDERLLSLAKKSGAAICTLDYNLNKVALVENIPILNINELAQSLRMAHLPGEHLMLELVQKGQDAHQAVGYLPDGTMVVVEHANKLMGQTVEVEIIRSLQTAAGRMMFARQIATKEPQPTKPAVPAAKKVLREDKPRQPEKQPRGRSRRPTQRNRQTPRQDPESNLINLVENS